MGLKWARLVALRSWALSLGGFGALTAAGFLVHPAAGAAVAGLSMLALEALTRPGDDTEVTR